PRHFGPGKQQRHQTSHLHSDHHGQSPAPRRRFFVQPPLIGFVDDSVTPRHCAHQWRQQIRHDKARQKNRDVFVKIAKHADEGTKSENQTAPCSGAEASFLLSFSTQTSSSVRTRPGSSRSIENRSAAATSGAAGRSTFFSARRRTCAATRSDSPC